MSAADVPLAFERFQLLRVLRQDGEMTFHDAFDPELGHPVTLITSPVGPDAAEEDRLAFRLPRMRHPNIVSVLAAGRQGSTAYVAAECLDSEPLSAFLARAGRIPVFHGLALVLQLLSAIEHAQDRRLVHATIDLEHVQVTRTGQLKLPAGGWSLSSDRQPNLEAAARIAQVLLSGVCGPNMRAALDEVLLRAQGPDLEARYPRAGEFALALLAAAGVPVSTRALAMERPLILAEAAADADAEAEAAAEAEAKADAAAEAEAHPGPGSASDLPMSKRHVTHAPQLARRQPGHRGRAGRHVLAVCLVAALLAPTLIRNPPSTDRKGAPGSVSTLPMGAPAAGAAPVRVALAPPAAPAIERIPIAPSPEVPSSAMPEIPELEAAPQPLVAPQPAARTAVRKPAVHANANAKSTPPPAAHANAKPTPPPVAHANASVKPAPSARQIRTAALAPKSAHAARARGIPVTAAIGCPYEMRIPRDLCEAQQCNRPQLRHTPTCVRMLAGQRAALARLQGTPD